MKHTERGLNIYEAAFLLLAYMKFRHYAPVNSWLVVVLPLAIMGIKIIVGKLAGIYGWENKIRFWIWKAFLKLKIRGKENEVRKMMADSFKKGTSNPGQFIDPTLTGKK